MTQGPGKPNTSRFYRSVNSELDHRDSTALHGYLLTAGARRVLERLAAARRASHGARAWTLTGPYGTGKSAFCVFVAQLFAPAKFPGRAEARTILRRGDSDLLEVVDHAPKSHRGLWPVVITGSREPIQLALLRAIHSSVAALPNKADSKLLRQITRALNNVAAGKPASERDIVGLLESVLFEVCSGNHAPAGLFLVVDELGKLLEFAASNPGDSDVYVLQHLAEFAARSSHPVLFLTVLHQDFLGYAAHLPSLERAEWDKVRGRFEDIIFEEPADEILRLVAEARGTAERPAQPRKYFLELCRQASKLGLNPPGMSKGEFTDLLTRSFPLHPMTALLLGQVFRKLAQNERSAFSFLTSSEPDGLVEFNGNGRHVDESCYGLHHLYDYLVHALGDGLYAQRNGKRWAEVESVLDRLPDATPTALATVKTIGLLNAIGEWRNVTPTAGIVRFALQGTASVGEVADALRWLQGRSAIIIRSYNESFAIWEGSDIDIDERVREARGRLNPSVTLANLARSFLTPKPVVARRHLFEKGTLRYFAVSFLHLSELGEALSEQPQEADGRILLLLPENAQEEEQIRELATSEAAAAAEDTVLALPTTRKAFDNLLREAAALDWVKRNTPTLEGDATARRELRARLVDVNGRLESLLSDMLSPSAASTPKCWWFCGGRNLKLESRRQLNGLLSSICDEVYHDTPVTLNELINRKELSSAAAAGRRNLIEAMLTGADQPELGIDGTPPEKSMYLSVLMKTGIHRAINGVFQFASPHNRSDRGIRAVWAGIKGFFDSCVEKPRPVSELLDLLMARPFGIRAGPSPVLVCAALISSDADVAVYEDGSFVPQLTTPVFERLMKAPARFTIRRWNVTGVRASVFNQLAEMLGKSKFVGRVGKRNILDVVRPLLRFAVQLNDYAKNTSRLRPEAIAIREALLAAREADQLLYTDLPTACGLPPIAANAAGGPDVAAHFLAELRRGISDLQRCYDELVAELLQAIANAFGLTGECSDVRCGLAGRANLLRGIASDTALKAFIVRATDTTLSDAAWVESLAALLSERPPAAWRDNDRSAFEVGLAKVSRLFLHLEPLAFGPQHTGSPNGHALRIGITSRDEPERERVVHVTQEELATVRHIERTLEDMLREVGSNGRREVMLAALAGLTQRLME